MFIDCNKKACETLKAIHESIDNKIRAIYNLGYKVGYEDGLKEAVNRILKKVIEEKETEIER